MEAGRGTARADQAVPSHWAARGDWPASVPTAPTAMQKVLVTHESLTNSLASTGEGSGVATTDQEPTVDRGVGAARAGPGAKRATPA